MKYIMIFFLICITIFSCRKEKDILSDSSAKLEFSVDSVLFDTVFSTVGSITHNFKVYNRNPGRIKISSLKLAGGSPSNYRINVDGSNEINQSDIYLDADDSLYVFVEVTIDPTDTATNPFVVKDSIVFEVNGNSQDIDLIAWGWDAYYHIPNQVMDVSDGSTLDFSYAGCESGWKADKPHLVYGCTVVEDSALVIPAGCRVYMHPKSFIWVKEGGSLVVNGEKDNKVYFQGDRLEDWYENSPGQWDRIWLSSGSVDNYINYAEIKNGNIGVHVDTVGNSSNPTLMISNTKITNMTSSAIFAQGSSIVGYNCEFSNCGVNLARLTLGGSYLFASCTFANYYIHASGNTSAVSLNNYYLDINENFQYRDMVQADFQNCIIYGQLNNEIGIDLSENSLNNYKFENCLLKYSGDTSEGINFIDNIVNPEGSIFNDYLNGDFSLSENSPAINKANPDYTSGFLEKDIVGNSRVSDEAPDIGAYEYVK